MRNTPLPTFLASALIFTLVALWSPPVAATPPVRCNGFIQFRPCTPENRVPPSAKRSRAMLARRPLPAVDAFGKVLSKKLTPVARRDGIWSGTVAGHGKVTLLLSIYRRGNIEDRWNIGSVILRGGDSTNYRFRASLPKGSDWSWEITVRATPVAFRQHGPLNVG